MATIGSIWLLITLLTRAHPTIVLDECTDIRAGPQIRSNLRATIYHHHHHQREQQVD